MCSSSSRQAGLVTCQAWQHAGGEQGSSVRGKRLQHLDAPPLPLHPATTTPITTATPAAAVNTTTTSATANPAVTRTTNTTTTTTH